MNSILYTEASFTKINEITRGNFILLVTATNTETDYLHNHIKSIDGNGKIFKILKNNLVYYLCAFGYYNVVHVQSGMGSSGRDAAISTIGEAIQNTNPKVVIMIGIAFGIDRKKQKIGDVFISEVILPYENARIGDKVIQRAIPVYASKLLVSRYKSLRGWEHRLDNGKKSEIIIANILSGEKLVDNILFRTKLHEAYPMAHGGEMEGLGLSTACGSDADWILIKGICDFADGKKRINKKKNQSIAIEAAIKAAKVLFESEYSFDGLDIYPNAFNTNTNSNIGNTENILFDIYKTSYEKYYLKREIDNTFLGKSNDYSVWLHGKSGAGKTAIMFRNLIIRNKEIYQVYLAGCINYEIDSLIKEIIIELSSQLNIQIEILDNHTFSQYVKDLYKLLLNNFSHKEVYIILDEVPISREQEHKEFTQKIIQLINIKSQYSELNGIKFIIASIHNPSSHIVDYQLKITQYLKILNIDYWNDKEITSLIEIIKNNLNIFLDESYDIILIEASKGCPRFIKTFYRNAISLKDFSKNGFDNALRETIVDMYYV